MTDFLKLISVIIVAVIGFQAIGNNIIPQLNYSFKDNLQYNYIISQVGTQYIVKNYQGQITKYTNSQQALQYAVDNLTQNRTQIEKILLIGTYIISNFTIPSYTHIEGLNALIRISENPDLPAFIVTHQDQNKITFQNLEFIGGETINNYVSKAIYFHHTAPYIKLYNFNLINCKFNKIILPVTVLAYYSNIQGNTFGEYSQTENLGPTTAGIYFPAAYQTTVKDNYFYTLGDGSTGLYIQDCTNIIVKNNYFTGDIINEWNNTATVIQSSSQIILQSNIYNYIQGTSIRIYNHFDMLPNNNIIDSNTFYNCSTIAETAIIKIDTEENYPVQGLTIINNQIEYTNTFIQLGQTNSTHTNLIQVISNTIQNAQYTYKLTGTAYIVNLYQNLFIDITNPPIIDAGTLNSANNVEV